MPPIRYWQHMHYRRPGKPLGGAHQEELGEEADSSPECVAAYAKRPLFPITCGKSTLVVIGSS